MLGEQLHEFGAGNLRTMPPSPLLVSLAEAALGSLESELSLVKLRSGETLFTEGEPGDALYVVVFGRLRALIHNGRHDDQVLGEIGRGEAVGEMALLTGEPRSATVRAVRDTALIKLSKAAFDSLIERHPPVMLEMARLIVARHQRIINPSVQRQPATVAIVPSQADFPAGDVAAGLVKALSSDRRVLSIDCGRLQRERGAPAERLAEDLDGTDVAHWLHEQELQHDLVVYVGDPLPSPWTRLCVRQADLVLVVGAGSGAGQLEPRLLEILQGDHSTTRARIELVLLYDSGQRPPSGTADWLARINVSAHHHLDPHVSRDYERLARMLFGRAIGLVLGGGGARALAHIGVIRALEEAHVPIDLVGGTSTGAVIAGQYASGWNSSRILEESRRVLVKGGSMNDFTVPVLALLRGRRHFRMLRRLFGNQRVEDLPLSFFCVSTNLTKSACTIHRAGLLHRHLAASCAVPGLRPPAAEGREILVDGGVLNNLPVDVMRNFGRGPVFASSVSPRADLCLNSEYPDIPSPWRVLWSWLNPFGTPMLVPSITSILMRTYSLQETTLQEQPDLMVEPPCDGFKQLDWRPLDEIAEAGYRTAVSAIERWESKKLRGEAS